ncbi:MAG: hypothetical protein R2755_29430 [Acidimicrobiales bacterium]
MASATAVESAAPAAAGVLAAPIVLQGQIDVAVEHDGAATSAFPALTQDLLADPSRCSPMTPPGHHREPRSARSGASKGCSAGATTFVLFTEKPGERHWRCRRQRGERPAHQ